MTDTLNRALSDGSELAGLANANLFVNGFMEISQEFGVYAVVSAGSTVNHVVDQWRAGSPLNGQMTYHWLANPFPTLPALRNGVRMRVTQAAAMTAPDSNAFQQYIEGGRCARLGYNTGKAVPLTIAFVARPNVDLIAYVSLRNNPVTRVFRQRIELKANVDNFVTFVVPGDPLAPLNLSTGIGLNFTLNLGAGSVGQATTPAGAWEAVTGIAAADVTNIAATLNNEITVGGFVALPGVVPITAALLPLLARHEADELRLCQRYYAKCAGNTRFYASVANIYGETPIYLPEPMRVVPTGGTISAGTRSQNIGTVSVGQLDNTAARHGLTATAIGDTYALGDLFYFNARMSAS